MWYFIFLIILWLFALTIGLFINQIRRFVKTIIHKLKSIKKEQDSCFVLQQGRVTGKTNFKNIKPGQALYYYEKSKKGWII